MKHEMKHDGSFDELKVIVHGLGFNIAEEKQTQNGWQLRTKEGAIVNWYTSTKVIYIQGKADIKNKFERAWADYNGDRESASNNTTSPFAPEVPANPTSANKKVFVVHGHDKDSLDQLELVLHKIGLDPFVLANTSSGGKTIIEALEAEIGPNRNAARFGIVLMTPDDIGYSKSDGSEKAQPRARQNVVLEMGMLISALGRGNVAILKKGEELEVPSDANGIVYIAYNDHVKEAVPRLAERLREAGFVLNAENIAKASS